MHMQNADTDSSLDNPNEMIPASITKHSNTELKVQWSNGELMVIPFIEVRVQCQCAECVDEWTRERRIQKKNIKPDIKPISVELVGRYAVSFKWSDGHKSGIFPFSHLYLLMKNYSDSLELKK